VNIHQGEEAMQAAVAAHAKAQSWKSNVLLLREHRSFQEEMHKAGLQ
jgi:hypothetical protein